MSGRRNEPGRRPALQSRGSWAVGRSQWNRRLPMNRPLQAAAGWSAVAGRGAEPGQTRSSTECCEWGQLALRSHGRRPSPLCPADSAKRGKGETIAARFNDSPPPCPPPGSERQQCCLEAPLHSIPPDPRARDSVPERRHFPRDKPAVLCPESVRRQAPAP